MGTPEIFVLAVLGILGIVVAVKLLLRLQAHKDASDLAKQVFPVWAAQGPFHSGAESAAAMRNAYLAVFGPDQTKEMADAIEGHETAYDGNPTAWEKNRRLALDAASSDALTLAEGIAAAEGLNKEWIEGGGHRLEFTKLSDGSTGLVRKKIWSDETIEEKKKEDDEALTSGIGQGLLDDSESSEEARELVEFLSDLYRAELNEEPDASALGKIWLACFTMSTEKAEPEPEPEPEIDPEILQTFKRLNEAHLATMPSDLEWSENPGCFERHLQRKHNNPLFPEPDREVNQKQIVEARERDQEDAANLQTECLELVSDVEKLPELATAGDVGPIRERIDDLLDRAAGIGGDADVISDLLITLRKSLVDSMREGMKDNEEALKALEDAEDYHHSRVEIVHNPYVAQVGRIPTEDLISAMLSESPETIRIAMSLISDDEKPSVVKEACDLLERALAEGADILLADEKLKAIKSEGSSAD